jgi:uncharacterized membrane protein YeaQ/YmgE (transglycosylase-associated protein family)
MATILNVISWLVFGLVVGAIARLIMPGRQSMSWLATALLGIAGSLVGGILSWLIFGTPEGTINAAGWVMSILGAIVAMVVYGKMNSGRGKTSSF